MEMLLQQALYDSIRIVPVFQSHPYQGISRKFIVAQLARFTCDLIFWSSAAGHLPALTFSTKADASSSPTQQLREATP